MARNIVVIGGGPAAVFAAHRGEEARRRRDRHAGDRRGAASPTRSRRCRRPCCSARSSPRTRRSPARAALAAHGVVLQRSARCTAIDRAAREVVTTAGRLPYDALVIATGSLMRELPLLPPGMPRVHYLRTEAHARALQSGAAGLQAPGGDRRRLDRARGRGVRRRARHRGDGDRSCAAHHGARLRRGDRRGASSPSTSTTASRSSCRRR